MPEGILDLDKLRELDRRRNLTIDEAAADGLTRDIVAETLRRGTIAAARLIVPDLPDEIVTAIEKLETDAVAGRRPQDLLRDAVARADVSDDVRDALTRDDLADRLELPADVSGDRPIDDLPEMHVELERAKVARLTGIAGLSDKASGAVLDRVDSLVSLGDQRIASLVVEGKINKNDARRIGVLAGLAQLAGGETDVVERVSGTRFSSLGGSIKNLTDVLKVDRDELAKALDPKLAAADPEAARARADEMRIRVEERFPAAGLAARLAPPKTERLRQSFQSIRKLLRDTPDILTAPPAELDEKQQAALADVRATINAYPGLGLEEIVRADAAPQATIAKITKRIQVFDKFAGQNSGIDLLRLDPAPGSADVEKLKFDGIAERDRDAVLEVVKARIRVHSIGGTVRTSAALMQAGYHSGFAVAESDPATIATRAGISRTEATIAHATARDLRLTVTNMVGTLVDELRWKGPGRVWIPWIPEDVTDGLRKLPGYDELFGDQSFCDCAHCDSILSPSAYFVDLMRFVDDNVTSRDFTGAKADHALKLENRRPDLWNVHLTCDNTHDLVPTLQVINEILEGAIAKRADAGLDTSDRVAVERKVYGEILPGAERSFVTPFDLSAAEADRYLTDFDTDRAEIVALIRPDASQDERNAAALRLSLAAYRMITTARTQWAYLQALYRMNFPHAGNTANPFDVQDVLTGMGISREAFGKLVDAGFVQGDDTIRILSQKRSAESVQNDIERVSGMTRGALDRAHRLWRLSAALGWDAGTLDLVLARMGGTLTDGTIATVIAVARRAERLSLDVDEALALSGPIPTSAVGGADRSLMDRLFNEVSGGAAATPFPAPTVRFIHPGLRGDASLPEVGPNADAFISQRLRVALGTTDADLLDLIRMLAPALGIDPGAAAEEDRGFFLTADALALLYRHALLSEALQLDMDELGRSIRIATGGTAIGGSDQLDMLLDLVDRLDDLPYDLAVIGALMGVGDDPVEAGTFIDAGTVADGVVAAIAMGERTLFAPTTFAFLDGVTEDQSRAIVAANSGLFSAADRDMLRLETSIPLAPTIAAPAGGFPAGIAEADLQGVLDGFNLRRLLPIEIASALDLTPQKLGALATIAGAGLAAQEVIDAAAGGDPAPLRAAVARLARPLAALDAEAATAERVAFVDANRGLFGLGDPTAGYQRHTVYALGAYLEALGAGGDADQRAAAVEAVLIAHTSAAGFDAADTDQLALAAEADAASVRVFEAGADLPDIAVLALGHLRRIVAFAHDRKIGADAVALLADSDSAALKAGVESLKAALQLRLGDKESFQAALEAHEDALRGRRRDALSDHMIRTSAGRFESRGDLYNYYLIDPDMEGCARTSRVVSAIGSLQTYIHRVVLNLEQDRRDPDAANHVHVSPTRIPAGEWEWRKNYRVWEANRKVFLWPENYMLPELRDNKTPLFETLEKTLLQQDITEQTVLDAYASYLRGFEDVANLRIAGAYHEYVWSDGRDVMHIFGCTADDPPVYYYWTIENLTFSKLRDDRRIAYSARRKIDVAIPVRDVSPILVNNRLHVFWLEKSTAPNNRVEDGESIFTGYRHTLSVRYSFLRLDGTWTPPQSMAMDAFYPLREGGVLIDYLTMKKTGSTARSPAYSDRLTGRSDYAEGYTLAAPAWQKVYPAFLGSDLFINVGARHVPFKLDMFERAAMALSADDLSRLRGSWDGHRETMHVRQAGEQRRIYEQTIHAPGSMMPASISARQDFVASRSTLERNILGRGVSETGISNYTNALNLAAGDLGASIAKVNDDEARVVVPISHHGFPAMFVQKASDVSFFAYNWDWSGSARPYEARRVGTTVLTDLGRTLFYDGVGGLLDKKAQAGFKEKSHLISSRNYRTKVVGPTTKLDFTGPLGVYFRELFLHIPALLAAHHNARGDYAAAQGWYQTIFDPTAKFDSGVDLEGLSPSARLQAERDRVWQYSEFHAMSPKSLRSILTDEDAQEAYRKDPFNPYAIGRLRLSAFQKNIVMRYVDNLLDWADSLFRQYQRETVDEAHILYDLARQILGPRPADVGDCGEGMVRPRTYARIKPHLEDGQDFLIEAENFWIHWKHAAAVKDAGLVAKREFIAVERNDLYAIDLKGKVESRVRTEMRFDATRVPGSAEKVAMATRGDTERMLADDKTVTRLPDALTAEPALPVLAEHVASDNRFVEAFANDGRPGRQLEWKTAGRVEHERAYGRKLGTAGRNWNKWGAMFPDDFTTSIVRQVGPVFCVPRNKDLLELWDRIEDRLYKIHNCRNIDGERVALALFAPEIDPMALVRARAAGLSLSDIFGASAGNLPPYRFTYLIAKAREYTALVQSYGAKLQGAIERRDGEELAKLRISQAINMQNLVTRIRENEVKIAKESLEGVKRRKAMFEYRKSYYEGRIAGDLLSWERAEQGLTHGAGASKALSAMLSGTAGIFYLIPQLGSPFAMKYGGAELGSSAKEWATVFKDTGAMLDLMARSASLEAKYENRRTDWKHQLELEGHELKQIEKHLEAAEIRVEIAERALENHNRSIEDQELLLDFYESKFSGEDLYTWMASTLQSIYRKAFNSAFSVARLAEQAYRFERPGDTATLLEPTYWEAGKAGLLSGEKLAVDLVAMEKRYLETNYRTLEITQPFSLAEIDPAALMRLRETGECDFTVPELAFDLLYPGHYRRRIRSVRLSIACVTGPYVNIPATLTLTGARMRIEPTQDGPAGLSDSLLRHTVQIATSTAQSDSGVFDFSFSDPRYMPFEGAGAVESTWKVTLPKTFRPFDYDTINDVVVHMSYSCESDGVLRERVEADNAALEGALARALSQSSLARAYSLRQELSTAFHQLTAGPAGVDVVAALDLRAVPRPLRGRDFSIDRALLLVRPGAGLSATGTEIRVNGTTLSGFAALPDFPGHVGTDATAAFAAGLTGEHVVRIIDAGDLAPDDGDGAAAFGDGAVEDIVIYVELSLD